MKSNKKREIKAIIICSVIICCIYFIAVITKKVGLSSDNGTFQVLCAYYISGLICCILAITLCIIPKRIKFPRFLIWNHLILFVGIAIVSQLFLQIDLIKVLVSFLGLDHFDWDSLWKAA